MRKRLVVAAATPVLVAAGIARLFVLPPTDPADGVDAVVMLAGDATTRLPVAVALAGEGAGVLAISVDEGEDNAPARALCEDPGDLEVHCFTATGSDTRSEARAVGDLVREEEWDTVAVVTNSYHITRAGVLVRRCTDADVAMVQARGGMSWKRWLVAVVRETGGLVVAAGSRSC